MMWQPIETAPKKGQVLLAARRHSFWFSEEWEFGVGEYLATRWPFLGAGQPTHWAPLSAPNAHNAHVDGTQPEHLTTDGAEPPAKDAK